MRPGASLLPVSGGRTATDRSLPVCPQVKNEVEWNGPIMFHQALTYGKMTIWTNRIPTAASASFFTRPSNSLADGGAELFSVRCWVARTASEIYGR